jgi:hypothetical protein
LAKFSRLTFMGFPHPTRNPAVAATQDKLLSSVKMERDEAMNLMNPVQQGKFLVMLGNWY